MIQLENVSKNYGTTEIVHALKNVNLTIQRGERVALMGPSGSGKSTFLNLVCGLDEPSSGSIKIDGIELSQLDDDARTRARREKIGMIFQTFNLLPTLTALENVTLPLRLQGIGRRETEERAAKMLERVGLKSREAPTGGDCKIAGVFAAAVTGGRADRKPGYGNRRRNSGHVGGIAPGI